MKQRLENLQIEKISYFQCLKVKNHYVSDECKNHSAIFFQAQMLIRWSQIYFLIVLNCILMQYRHETADG